MSVTGNAQSVSDTSNLPEPLSLILKGISDKYDNGQKDDSQVVAYKDTIIDECEKYGYCSEQLIHVKRVGIHPSNRDKAGIHVIRAQTRVQKILLAGFSWRAIKENLVAAEDHPTKKHVEKFTLETCAKSAKYADYKAGEIRAGSLGAGHANHGFAMLHDKRPCDIESISENGRLSHDKCFKDVGMMNATTNGMMWKVLRWEVEAAFPSIPRIVQAALNMVTQIAE